MSLLYYICQGNGILVLLLTPKSILEKQKSGLFTWMIQFMKNIIQAFENVVIIKLQLNMFNILNIEDKIENEK